MAPPSRHLYLNGEILPCETARIHVHSNAVKFGTSVFEGLRACWNAQRGELYVFRLRDHVDRLRNSLRLMRMEHSFTREELTFSISELLRKNEVREDITCPAGRLPRRSRASLGCE